MIAPISLLFVPGSAPDRFAKALASEADMICLDLEDAVAPADKARARAAAIDFVAESEAAARLCIRLNRLGSAEGIDDLAALTRMPCLPALMLPKVETARDMEIVAQVLGARSPPLIALLESAGGIEAAFEIAACPAVSALMFGGFDYAAEIGCTQAWDVLAPARNRIVAAAAAAGLAAIDSPAADLIDTDANTAEAGRARDMGFTGKAAIHPRMIEGIRDAFALDPAARAEAEAIVAAFEAAGGGAARIGGRLIEKPVVLRMQRILARREARYADVMDAADDPALRPS